MENPQPAIPWVGVPIVGRQREAVGGNKDFNKEVLQAISDSWYVASEHKAEQGQPVLQVQ